MDHQTVTKKMSKKEVNRRVGRVIVMALLAATREDLQQEDTYETGDRIGEGLDGRPERNRVRNT